MRIRALLLVGWCLFVVACAGPQRAEAVAPAAVAAPPRRVPAPAELLRAALDDEALYTLAGGLKPVSIGFWSDWLDVAQPDLTAIATVRNALAVWRTDALWADVLAFHQVHAGRRAVQAYVVDRVALARTVQQHAAFFAPYGIAADTHPAELFAIVERMPAAARHRGQGLLYGYPQHAIDFFVAAQQRQADGEPMVPRRFVQIPTFGAAEGAFVYAVPKEHADNEADRALREAAQRVLLRYRTLRASADLTTTTGLQQLVAALRAESVGAADHSTTDHTAPVDGVSGGSIRHTGGSMALMGSGRSAPW